jgi:hypothetical protein
LNAALEAFAAVYRNNDGAGLRRTISAKGRARIAAAQKARWAKVKEIKIVPPKPGKRVTSDVSVGSPQDRSSSAGAVGKSAPHTGEEGRVAEYKPI